MKTKTLHKKSSKKHSHFFDSDKAEFLSHKKRYLIIFASLAVVFILSLTLIIIDSTAGVFNFNPTTKMGGWPTTVLAPYADMTSWVNDATGYGVNGVADLNRVSTETGMKYFNLGFIVPSTSKPTNDNGDINWTWGGYSSIGENGADAYQYAGIVYALKKIRDNGGDYCISFGGQYGNAPWVVSSSPEKLEKMYTEVIEKYDAKRIDLDIEESNQGEQVNRINAQAIKAVQDKTGVAVTLTIPIMPSGWEEKQLKIIRAYLDAGVDIALINSMTMCYGTGLYSGEDYGDASVRAITNSIEQMKNLYTNYGINLTTAQAYKKTGATVSIGYESSLYPTFTTKMMQKVYDDAIKNGYGMLSFWSINRDSQMETNRAISTRYQYFDIIKSFGV